MRTLNRLQTPKPALLNWVKLTGREKGMVLQLNMEHRNKAATLLGILEDAHVANPSTQ